MLDMYDSEKHYRDVVEAALRMSSCSSTLIIRLLLAHNKFVVMNDRDGRDIDYY